MDSVTHLVENFWRTWSTDTKVRTTSYSIAHSTGKKVLLSSYLNGHTWAFRLQIRFESENHLLQNTKQFSKSLLSSFHLNDYGSPQIFAHRSTLRSTKTAPQENTA